MDGKTNQYTIFLNNDLTFSIENAEDLIEDLKQALED